MVNALRRTKTSTGRADLEDIAKVHVPREGF